MKLKALLFLPLLLGSLFNLSCSAQQPSTASPGKNLARGLPATFNAPPNYALCTDPGDAMQLTDGVYSGDGAKPSNAADVIAIWRLKETVGWNYVSPVTIGFDLGQVRPISGVSLSGAAGITQVYWPRSIAIMVSDENQTWRYVGEVMSLSRAKGLPPIAEYSHHRFIADNLQARGRYVKFIVDVSSTYFFSDEIEIYEGAPSLLKGTTVARGVGDLKAATQFVADRATDYGMMMRLSRDYDAVHREVLESRLAAQAKQTLLARLERASRAMNDLPPPDAKTFRAVIPFNAPHAEILAVHAAVLKSRGLPDFFPWKTHRYDYLSMLSAPGAAPAAPPALAIRMMTGEQRADMVLLTNTGETNVAATLQVQGLPGGARPSWLNVAEVPWTDTSQNDPTAVALPDAKYAAGSYRFDVPAGLTRKVWLTVDSTQLPAGNYNGSLLLSANGRSWKMPFSLNISTVRMNRPRLSLSAWDYTNGDGLYGITPTNRQAAIHLMRSHYLDTAWAFSSALPLPTAADFDANDNLKKLPDFQEFDRWISYWPDARRYLVFLNQPSGYFADAKMGTPQFDKRVGAWAKVVAQHMRDLKLEPRQLGFMIIDEPLNDEQNALVAAWAGAIKAAAPELTLFSDPAWRHPSQSQVQKAFTLMDILCPDLQIIQYGGAGAQQYYEARRRAGQTLWLYRASAPARLTDPELYYRNMAWKAFRYNATGITFWSFADIGGAYSSWNEYTIKSGTVYSPGFLSPDGALDTIQWQAVREGIEDYEYLTMLRDAASRTQDANLKNQAVALLSTPAIDGVLGEVAENWAWSNASSHGEFDSYRLKVLALLEKMQNPTESTYLLR